MARDQVSSPQDIPLRPLTKGMFRDKASNLIDVGGFYDLKNFIATDKGLQLRSGYGLYSNLTQTANPPIKDLTTLWFTNGEKETILFDSNGVFKVASTGYVEIGTDEISIVGGENVDFATFVDLLYVTDNVSPVQVYNGSSIANFDSGKWNAKCMAYHKDRLFIGNVKEVSSGDQFRQMLRWTSVAPSTTGNFDDNFLNLPYISDEMLRIVPLGDMLVLYFENSIWIGRETNILGDTLPFEFSKLDTNNVGLVGMKAVVPFTDGHFFVGQDDIYFLGVDTSLRRIGSAIFDEFIQDSNFKYNIYASLDQSNKCAVFGIPDENGTNFQRIIRYDYTINAWSYDEYAGTFLANLNVTTGLTIDELTGTIDDLDGTIDSLSGSASGISLWTGFNGYLLNYNKRELVDYSDAVISGTFETGDFDLGDLNTRKTFTELSIRLRENYSQGISDADRVLIHLYASVDKGSNWKKIGICQILDGRREYEVNFRVTGDNVRFRGSLDTTQSTNTFIIEEIVLRGKSRGVQGNRE